MPAEQHTSNHAALYQELVNMISNEVYYDLIKMLREIRQHEAVSKIRKREEKYRQYHHSRAYNITHKNILRNMLNKRTKHK